ncbi:MAG: MFS transporter, partial [Planctomycetota bacterium]
TVETGWGVALALLDFQSVLPVIAARLGTGWSSVAMLPVLYYAVFPIEVLSPYYTEALPRKKRLVWLAHLLPPVVWGALGIWLLSGPEPGTRSLAIFYGGWLLSYAVTGFLNPAWFDFMGKITDPARRGSAFSLIFSFQSVAGLTAALIVSQLVKPVATSDFAWLFIVACIAAQVSNQAFAGTVEEAGSPPPPRPPLREYARSLVVFLREDRSLRRYICARAVTRAAPAIATFYAVQATRHHPASVAVAFAATVVAGKLTMSLSAWRFSDGLGMKPFLVAGYLALATAGATVALADAYGLPLVAFYAVAFLVGCFQSADTSSNATFVMNLAPEGKRSSYLIAVNASLFPLATGLPLLVGWIADRLKAAGHGPAPLQAVVAGLVLLAAIFLAVMVDERRVRPRRSS